METLNPNITYSIISLFWFMFMFFYFLFFIYRFPIMCQCLDNSLTQTPPPRPPNRHVYIYIYIYVVYRFSSRVLLCQCEYHVAYFNPNEPISRKGLPFINKHFFLVHKAIKTQPSRQKRSPLQKRKRKETACFFDSWKPHKFSSHSYLYTI